MEKESIQNILIRKSNAVDVDVANFVRIATALFSSRYKTQKYRF